MTYDIAIIGGGPAGLSAALNAAADGFSALVLEAQENIGGQAKHTDAIENYGGHARVSGSALCDLTYRQGLSFGARYSLGDPVLDIARDGDRRIVLADSGEYAARAVLIAAGQRWRRLGCSEEHCFLGRGIYYGARPEDAQRHEGQDVVIVGGANSAGQAALYWSTYARHIYLVIRAESIDASMSAYLIERILRTPNITVLCECELTRAHGEAELSRITLQGRDWAADVDARAVLIFIGSEPATHWLPKEIERNERGFIRTDAFFRTTMGGVFAIGDVRDGIAKRVGAAMGDGSAAISCVARYLKGVPLPEAKPLMVTV